MQDYIYPSHPARSQTPTHHSLCESFVAIYDSSLILLFNSSFSFSITWFFSFYLEVDRLPCISVLLYSS